MTAARAHVVSIGLQAGLPPMTPQFSYNFYLKLLCVYFQMLSNINVCRMECYPKKVYWLLAFCFSSFLYINVKECGKGNSSAEVANKQHHFVGCFWWSVLVLLLGNGPEQRCVGRRGRGAAGGWRASEGGCASGLGAFRPPVRCLEASTCFYRILRTLGEQTLHRSSQHRKQFRIKALWIAVRYRAELRLRQEKWRRQREGSASANQTRRPLSAWRAVGGRAVL